MTPKRKPPESVMTSEFFAKFAEDSHRAAGIMAGAMLEVLLERLIRSSIVDDAQKKTVDRFFSDRGVAGSFSAKIDLAYLVGWISSGTHRDLNIVRDIRNDFAHAADHTLTFDDSRLTQWVNSLAALAAVREGQRYLAEVVRQDRPDGAAAADLLLEYIRTQPTKDAFQSALGLLGYELQIAASHASHAKSPERRQL